jgi:hypothetical protein
MKLDLESKIKELFRKHMDLTEHRPQAQDLPERERAVTEADFEDQYYHQQEYFSWVMEEGKLKFYGGMGISPILLGLFFGQEEKLKIIHKEFAEYLDEAELHLRSKVATAMQELMKYNIPCEKIHLPYYWAKVVDGEYLGMQVVSSEYTDDDNSIVKIESPNRYGRFVTFSLE